MSGARSSAAMRSSADVMRNPHEVAYWPTGGTVHPDIEEVKSQPREFKQLASKRCPVPSYEAVAPRSGRRGKSRGAPGAGTS